MYSQICTFSGELQRNRKALSTHSEHNSDTVNFIQLKNTTLDKYGEQETKSVV